MVDERTRRSLIRAAGPAGVAAALALAGCAEPEDEPPGAGQTPEGESPGEDETPDEGTPAGAGGGDGDGPY